MDSEQEFNCIFCEEVFDDKEAFQIHFRKHGDPQFKSKVTEVPVQTKRHVDVDEVVSCDVCDKTFPTISKAITHKHKVHRDHDSKHFCPWCGKLFTMKHLYNKHMQTNHSSLIVDESDEVEFHCDSCNVDFYVPSAMVHHNRFFHRQDSEIIGIGYSKKVKIFKQELIQISYCSFCGEEYNNKVNLFKHMTDEHEDENQKPEDIFRCPLCEAIFYHLDAYELHLTFHSSEDLYSEKNEMVDEITEFSLEAVPPLLEKLQKDSEMSDGIENFLHMVMEESADNEVSDNIPDALVDKSKVKKHKKHKKSKKAAITLDEFLNMNKDVFGDGFGDIQGIEEVPTQVVLKKGKSKRVARDNEFKKVSTAEIEKLKKQGIVVKKKSCKIPLLNNKLVPGQIVKVKKSAVIKTPAQTNSNVIRTSNEVLTKLINQGNSQIQIKKCVPNNNANEQSTHQSVPLKDDPEFNKLLPTKVSGSDLDTKNLLESDVNEPVEDDEVEGNNETLIKNDIESRHNEPLKDTEIESKTNASGISNISEIVNQLVSEINGQVNTETSQPENTEIKPERSINPLRNIKIVKTTPRNEVQNKLALSTEQPENDISSKEDTSFEQNEMEIPDQNVITKESPKKPIPALQHLSHLTIKSVNVVNKDVDVNDYEPQKIERSTPVTYSEISKGNSSKPEDQKSHQSKSLEALKNLSKHITIVPPKQSTMLSNICTKSENESEDDENNFDEFDETMSTALSANKDNIPKPVQITEMKSLKMIQHIKQEPKTAPKLIRSEETKESYQENETQKDVNKASEILKRLSNVTAVPVAKKLSQPIVTKMIAQPISSMSQRENIIKCQKIDQDVEILNIDDSDSDDIDRNINDKKQITPPPKTNIDKNIPSLDTFKQLHKNITIKSVNQQNISKNEPLNKKTAVDRLTDNLDTENKQTSTNQNMINLQSRFKSLGSHITVKSNKPAPNLVKFRDMNSENGNDDFADNAGDSDSDVSVGKVKITELNNDNMSDDEEFSNKHDEKEFEKNAIVQSPDGSDSDDSFNGKNEDEVVQQHSDSDSETHLISANKEGQSSSSMKQPSYLSKLKNVSNELTIKSVAEKTPINENNSSNSSFEIPVNKLNSALSIKPLKRNTNHGNTPNMESCNKERSQLSSNQKVSSTSNQVNTTKTVQTFQSNTVIEEITTTVTKTIRTINQVRQVVQSSNQTNKPGIRPQKIMNPGQQNSKYQGVTVRHANPPIGAKIVRKPTPTTQVSFPAPSTPVNQSNKLVPVRPGLNIARPRPTNPVKSVSSPESSPQNVMIGKTLKISPHAMNKTVKRISEDAAGHFSCFKKPKESLIPGSDMSSQFKNDQESTVNFASTSQSRSEFCSTSKVVKGKSVVTATQVKSQMTTTSQQHLSKLNNLSGLKIVKSSTKQAAHVEERSEVNTSNKGTLDALEKLQKQGLLIKKPRINPTDIQTPEDDDNFSDQGTDNEDDT